MTRENAVAPARENLIFATIDLVRRRGVAGTGLAEIIKASGRSRRTVYLNFPAGKEEMVREATQFAGEATSRSIAALTSTQPPDQVLRTLIAGWISTLERSQHRSGCPILAAALGRHDAPTASDAAGVAFGDWIKLVTDSLTRSGVSSEPARDMATTVVAAIEGAIAMCLATSSTEPLKRVESTLLRTIATHTDQSTVGR